MIEENESQENQVFELVRILHKTKLTFDHEYIQEDGQAFYQRLFPKYFSPDDCITYQTAYWILKTTSFKSSSSLPYDKLFKMCLLIPTMKQIDEFYLCQRYLMKMMTLCVRKVFKKVTRNQDFFARFDIACQKLTTELIGFYDSKLFIELTSEQFNIKSALDEIDTNLYNLEENSDYPTKINQENVEQVHYLFFKLNLAIMSSKNSLLYRPYIQEKFLFYWTNYVQFIQKYQVLSTFQILIVNDLILFLNKYFRGKVERFSDGTAKGIDCLRKIINLIYLKTKDFSKEIVIMHNDPLSNIVNLLNYLQELKVLDQICLDEAALALQKCILIITKDSYNKNFFEQDSQEVSEQLFLNKIKIMATFLLDQKKNININNKNLLFFIGVLNHIEDQQIKQNLNKSIHMNQYDDDLEQVKYLVQGIQGDFILQDVENIVGHFKSLLEFPVNDEVFVNYLIDANYNIDSEMSKETIIRLYHKDNLQMLAKNRPYALKFLFFFSYKLDQELVLSLREEKNIFYEIFQLLDCNSHTDTIISILKTLLNYLDYIFKSKQGLYEESVAGMNEYIQNLQLQDIKDEWEQLEGKVRMKRIIDFTETYNLFNIILFYPLEIEKIQDTLLNLRKKELVNCFYTKLPYCCGECGKKTKEYYQLQNSIKRPNIICSNCESQIPIYILKCNFKIDISQEMRNYIHNTSKRFFESFSSQINSLRKVAQRNYKDQDISSLNIIFTQFDPLIVLHFHHLKQQIKFDFD
ncbi:hypothetical protein ABPG74_020349 [Tetrahymena malaccensis]